MFYNKLIAILSSPTALNRSEINQVITRIISENYASMPMANIQDLIFQETGRELSIDGIVHRAVRIPGITRNVRDGVSGTVAVITWTTKKEQLLRKLWPRGSKQ